MQLRTILPFEESQVKIDLGDKYLTMGSCFANSIGSLLEENKLSTMVNPFGTIYDPISIARILNYAMDGTMPSEDSYIETNGTYANLFTHSSFSALNPEEVKLRIQGTLTTVSKFITHADWLIITFGTAWVYSYNKSGEIVANCHKVPASQFTKSLCQSEVITEIYQQLDKKLLEINPNIKILITVSPVRHIKDTLPKNNLSKSVLRVFSHELESKHDNIFYYPAYELLMDDLRDYRFYKEDMIHPSDQAISYIWEHFIQSYANMKTKEFIESWQKLKKSLQHKPFHPQSKKHQQFLLNLITRLNKFENVVDIAKEKQLIEAQII